MDSKTQLTLLCKIRAEVQLVNQDDIKELKSEGLIETDGSVRLFVRCLTEKGQETLERLERETAFHFDVGNYEGWVYAVRDRRDGTEAIRVQLIEKQSVNQGDFVTADHGATFFRMAPVMFASNYYIHGTPVSDSKLNALLKNVVDEYAQGGNAKSAPPNKSR